MHPDLKDEAGPKPSHTLFNENQNNILRLLIARANEDGRTLHREIIGCYLKGQAEEFWGRYYIR